MIIISFILLYALSVLLIRYLYRLHSSKHLDLWLNEDCHFEILWVIPILNTLSALVLFLIMMNKIVNYKIKSKLLNTDL